jgi:hypothetical protein
MTQQPSGTASTAVKVKGNFAYGFTLLPNILRDQLMPLAGTDAFAFAYLILSWAAEGTRDARLSARYTKTTTGWGPDRLQAAKTALLKAWPQVFTMLPGDSKLSRPEMWQVDMDTLSRMHAAFLLEQGDQQPKRGPGRPRKPVQASDTGFLNSWGENPVQASDTGFPTNFANFEKTLFRHTTHPCSGIRHTPVQAYDTHKDITKKYPKKRGGALHVTGDASGESLSPPVDEPGSAQHSSRNATLQTSTHEAGPVISLPADLPVLEMIRTPVDEPSPAQHSSRDAALQTPTHEAEPVTPPLTDLPLPQVPSSPTGTLEGPPPVGVAADAAGDVLTVTDEDADFLFGTGTSTEALETVPGGGAAGEAAAEAPSGAALPALALTVAELLPIPPTDLASRPVAGSESEKALREAVGKQFPTYAAEKTRTGNLSRELWGKLTVEEIRRVTLTARLEASTSKDNLITLVVRGLDRLIGAVKPPKVVVPAAADGKVLGPVDLSHLDPHLPEGARCSVGSQLGVVKSVRQNGYIIELDGGDMMTLDRFVAGHLISLKPSTEPRVTTLTSSEAVVVLAKVGSVYRDLSTGAEVEVKAVQGANRLLNTGHTIPCYQLVNAARFERVST